MNKQTDLKKIAELRKTIEYHNKRYYQQDSPEIEDYEYDLLMRELQELEDRYPEAYSASSPTQHVGAPPLSSFASFNHPSPMLSIKDAFSKKEILDFDIRIKNVIKSDEILYVAEPKIDGLAVNLIYENGLFIRGATRGDGTTGEDVTQNLRTINFFPKIINEISGSSYPIPSFLEVRGEVYIEIEQLKKLNQERIENGEEPFANPRNLAAGSLRQLDPDVTIKRPLKICVYAVGNVSGISFSTQLEVLKTLKKWGFPVNEDIREQALDINSCINYFEHIGAIRKDLHYKIDGVVIKVNDLSQQKLLGNISRSPRWALACKFPPVQEETKIIRIEVQVGRTGILTPVAIMEPVNVDGVIVSRATLHNEDEVLKKDVREGDTVVIQRAGDVIPEVVKVIPEKRTGREKEFKMPSHCPKCNSSIVRLEGQVANRCINFSCPAKLKGAILHYGSRLALNIDGLGEELVEKLIKDNIVKTPADLYRLDIATFANLERMGDLSAANIVAAIEKSKYTTLERFIYALGIPEVGETTAKTIARFFGNIDRLMNAHPKTMQYLLDIGIEVNKSIYQFFKETHNKEVILKLRTSGISWDDPISEVSFKETSLSDFLNWLGTKCEGGWQNLIKTKIESERNILLKIIRNIINSNNLLNKDLPQIDESIFTIKEINKDLAKSLFIFFNNPENRIFFWEGIDGLGRVKAKILADKFGSLENIINANQTDFSSIDGINSKLAKDIVKFFKEPDTLKVIHQLRECGVNWDHNLKDKNISSSQIRGKTFVLTGTLDNLKRDEAKKKIEELGGKISGSVSKKTDYLIVGAEAGSKLSDAMQLGIKIFNEEQFLNLLGEESQKEKDL